MSSENEFAFIATDQSLDFEKQELKNMKLDSFASIEQAFEELKKELKKVNDSAAMSPFDQPAKKLVYALKSSAKILSDSDDIPSVELACSHVIESFDTLDKILASKFVKQ